MERLLSCLLFLASSHISALDMPFNHQYRRYKAMASLMDEGVFPGNGVNNFQHTESHNNFHGQDFQSYIDDFPGGNEFQNNNYNGQDLNSFLDDLPKGQIFNGARNTGLRSHPDHMYNNMFESNPMTGLQPNHIVQDSHVNNGRPNVQHSIHNMNPGQFEDIVTPIMMAQKSNSMTFNNNNHARLNVPNFSKMFKPRITPGVQTAHVPVLPTVSGVVNYQQREINKQFHTRPDQHNVNLKTNNAQPKFNGLNAVLSKGNANSEISQSPLATKVNIQSYTVTTTVNPNIQALKTNPHLPKPEKGNYPIEIHETSRTPDAPNNKPSLLNSGPDFIDTQTTGSQHKGKISSPKPLTVKGDTNKAGTNNPNPPTPRMIKRVIEGNLFRNIGRPINARVETFSPAMIEQFKKMILSKLSNKRQL